MLANPCQLCEYHPVRRVEDALGPTAPSDSIIIMGGSRPGHLRTFWDIQRDKVQKRAYMVEYQRKLLKKARSIFEKRYPELEITEEVYDDFVKSLTSLGLYLSTRLDNAHRLALQCKTLEAMSILLTEDEKKQISTEAIRKRLNRAEPQILAIFKTTIYDEENERI